ncbi:MAG: septum site-determining protein MinC [Tepidimonas sp.]|nr:septum site-determining protein MinC [Tepidimonas sp.]
MTRTLSSDVALEIRPTAWPVLCARLRGGRIETVLAELQQRYGATGFFDQEPLLLDFSQWSAPEAPTALEVDALLRGLKAVGLRPLAYQGASAGWQPLLQAQGLLPAADGVQGIAAEPAAAPPPPPSGATAQPARTLVVDRPLRSGQQVYARGGDLVVLAMVNPGAEVIADGHVHVYAPLRGRVIAGARGDAAARIFALIFEPELVSIAGVYQTAERGWPPAVQGRAAQVRLRHEGGRDTLLFEPL